MYLIRVTSNSIFGKGHINRCLRIREKLNGKVIWFVDKDTKENFQKNNTDHVIEEKQIGSINKLREYSEKNQAKAIIIDMVDCKGLKIEKISAIVPTVLIVDKYYKNKNTLRICLHPILNSDEGFLSGIKYFPYKKKKQYSYKSASEKNILVSFGNVDSKGLTEKTIKVLLNLFEENIAYKNNFKINVVIGKQKKNINFIKKILFDQESFKLHFNLDKLDNIYKKTFFAIGAPGFSQVERSEYGIPTLLIAQNELQKKVITILEKKRLCISKQKQ